MKSCSIEVMIFAMKSYRHSLVPLFLAVVLAACAPVPRVPAAVMGMDPVTLPVHAPARSFQDWLGNFSVMARAAGIDDATLQAALGSAQYIPRVVELDRSQPEFNRSIWDYLDTAVSPQRVARGQEKLHSLRPQLAPIAEHYGVPLEVLFAFWGIESDFGNNFGSFSVIDSLATLGYDGRREAWAQQELLAALKILQHHDIERAQMIGSWAGAMGQTQFMPTVFLAEAVDQDGDGRRDLWGSIPDVMASTANFVAHSGWQRGQPWLVEVQLPTDFDYALAEPNTQLSTAEWAQRGVKAMAGNALPPLTDAAILLPAGAKGPVFLVGANYRTILKYNNSTSYALAVGLLAQQLMGRVGVQAPWPRDQRFLARSALRKLQWALNARGFDVGPPDGLMGPNTSRGVRQLQRSLGLPADGFPTQDLMARLEESSAAAVDGPMSGLPQ